MQKVISLFTRRKVSTQRVDDMASNAARIALEQRLNRMVAAHAALPEPQRKTFAPLSNPIQKVGNP